MKKVFLLVAFSLVVILSPVIAKEDVQQKKTSEVKEAITQPVKENYVSVIKSDMSRLFTDDTLALIFFDINEENICKLETLVLDNINEKIKDDYDDKTQDIMMGFQVFRNMTTVFGPDFVIGIQPVEKNIKSPSFLGAINIKVNNFDPVAVQQLIGKKYEFKKQNIEGTIVYSADLKKDSIVFARFKNYFLISNKVEAISNAIVAYNNYNPGLLADKLARKTISYTPDKSLVSVLINNKAIAEIYPQIVEEAKKEQLERERKAAEEELKRQKEIEETELENVTDDESTEKPVEEVQEPEKKTIAKVKVKKSSTPYPFSDELMMKYMQNFSNVNHFSVISIDLQPDKVLINSFAPVNLSFLDNINPELKTSLENLYDVSTVYNISESLPKKTFSYIMVSNLGYLNQVLNSIKHKDLQKGMAMVKVMFSAATGLDLDSDIFPIFRGQLTVAGVEYKDETSPIVLLSYKPETINTFNTLITVAAKMGKAIKPETKKIKGTNVVVISDEAMPFPVAYGKFKDNVIIGDFDVVKRLIKKQKKNKIFLSADKSYKAYLKRSEAPQFMKMYINMNEAGALLAKSMPSGISEKAVNMVESVYFDVTKPEDDLFASELIIQFKPKLESKKH